MRHKICKAVLKFYTFFFSANSIASFTGMLNVNLIGVQTILRKIELVGIVGTVNLVIEGVAGDKLHLTHGEYILQISNSKQANKLNMFVIPNLIFQNQQVLQ